MAFAILTMVPARAFAQKLPSLFFSPGSQASRLSSPWMGSGVVSGAGLRPAIFAYELVAYVAKELLDDTSYEYQESPIGSYLRRQTPAEHSRSEVSLLSPPIAAPDPPPTLDYPVRRVALRDLWSRLHQGSRDDRSAFSLDPKIGAGRAGFIFSFRW